MKKKSVFSGIFGKKDNHERYNVYSNFPKFPFQLIFGFLEIQKFPNFLEIIPVNFGTFSPRFEIFWKGPCSIVLNARIQLKTRNQNQSNDKPVTRTEAIESTNQNYKQVHVADGKRKSFWERMVICFSFTSWCNKVAQVLNPNGNGKYWIKWSNANYVWRPSETGSIKKPTFVLRV